MRVRIAERTKRQATDPRRRLRDARLRRTCVHSARNPSNPTRKRTANWKTDLDTPLLQGDTLLLPRHRCKATTHPAGRPEPSAQTPAGTGTRAPREPHLLPVGLQAGGPSKGSSWEEKANKNAHRLQLSRSLGQGAGVAKRESPRECRAGYGAWRCFNRGAFPHDIETLC